MHQTHQLFNSIRYSTHVTNCKKRIMYHRLKGHAALDRQRWAAIVTMASDTNGR